jgi:hypothetical protein
VNIGCSGIAACPYDASPAVDMKSRVHFGASAAIAQRPGPITNEILRRNDFAGYEIFTQVSYQYGGLIFWYPDSRLAVDIMYKVLCGASLQSAI